MTTDAPISLKPPTACIEPLYFRSSGVQLAGFLHRPGVVTGANTGVVLCEPFGYEAICSHRSLVSFAQAAASTGMPVLRFHYSSSGDSEDTDPGVEQIQTWSQDVVAAVSELRSRTGVERVCLLGFRLGALIAALAAPHCDAVTSFIAVAPIVNGSKHLRELRTIQLAAARNGAPAAGPGAPFDISGFTLSAATVAALAAADLSALEPPATDMLIIDRSDLRSAKAWAAHCTERGARVQYECLQGFVRMMMTAPHLAVIPQPMITLMKEWLAQRVVPNPVPGNADSPPHAAEILVLSDAGDANSSSSREQAVILGPRQLFTVLAEPPAGVRRRGGVILLNAGATYHIGPNRMYVSLARRWARAGYAVARIDLTSLGDSTLESAGWDCEVFPASALDDIAAAVQFVRDRYEVSDITLAGLCSGAYHALRAAAAGQSITRILMVNPLHYLERPGITQQELQWLGYIHNPQLYRQQVLPAGFWKALIARRLDVLQWAKLHVQHSLVKARRVLRSAARLADVKLRVDLGRELEQIAARGVDMVFVFGRGEPGLAILGNEAGSSLEKLGKRCRVHVLENTDHIFSESRPRAALEDLLSSELFTGNGSEATGPSSARSAFKLGSGQPADQQENPISG